MLVGNNDAGGSDAGLDGHTERVLGSTNDSAEPKEPGTCFCPSCSRSPNNPILASGGDSRPEICSPQEKVQCAPFCWRSTEMTEPESEPTLKQSTDDRPTITPPLQSSSVHRRSGRSGAATVGDSDVMGTLNPSQSAVAPQLTHLDLGGERTEQNDNECQSVKKRKLGSGGCDDGPREPRAAPDEHHVSLRHRKQRKSLPSTSLGPHTQERRSGRCGDEHLSAMAEREKDITVDSASDDGMEHQDRESSAGSTNHISDLSDGERAPTASPQGTPKHVSSDPRGDATRALSGPSVMLGRDHQKTAHEVRRRLELDHAPAFREADLYNLLQSLQWPPTVTYRRNGSFSINISAKCAPACDTNDETEDATNRSQRSEHMRGKRLRYTEQDDKLLLELVQQNLAWDEIAKSFPGRSVPALRARYSTKYSTRPRNGEAD